MKVLALLACDAPAYLLTEHGKPLTSSGRLDNRVRKWIVEVGLVDENGNANRSQRGVRKRRAEIIAEGGGAVCEVMGFCRTAIRKLLRSIQKGLIASVSQSVQQGAKEVADTTRGPVVQKPWDASHSAGQ